MRKFFSTLLKNEYNDAIIILWRNEMKILKKLKDDISFVFKKEESVIEIPRRDIVQIYMGHDIQQVTFNFRGLEETRHLNVFYSKKTTSGQLLVVLENDNIMSVQLSLPLHKLFI